MRPICRSITVVITIPANAATAGARFKFPDVPELREKGVMVYGFQSTDADTITNTLDGNAVITAADADKVLVTLVEKSNQRFQLIPYNLFNQAITSGIWFETTPFVWEPQQSFVNITLATVSVAVQSLPFVVHFRKPGDPV